jgi:glycosyltransferase involved in cell wall biosynthesis
MRILQLSNRVPWPLTEGGTIGIYNFTKQFNLLGNEVTLFCLDGNKHHTPVQEAHSELSKYADVYIHSIDTRVKPVDAFIALLQNKSYNVSRFYNESFNNELIKLLKNQSFDVIQLEGTFVGPYVETVKKYSKALISLRMHNAEFEIWERLAANSTNPVKKWYLNKLARQLKDYEQVLVGKVDCVVPVTDSDGAKLKGLNNHIKLKTIPAAVNLSQWRFTPSSSFNNWYHIGNMEWHANKEAVDWFVRDVHPKLLKADASYTFHLAGKSLDASLYAQDGIKSYARVEDAFEFIKPLDVCVVPLKSGSGIRIKILEAMAAGKLVISTTIGAQGINYKEGEHLLLADDPVSFSELYQKLQAKEIDYPKIVKSARKLIEENYSEEGLANELLAYYKSLIS